MATRSVAVLMEDQRIKDAAAKTARLKALREKALASGWTPPVVKPKAKPYVVKVCGIMNNNATRHFLELINTSAGPDECHPWTGQTDWNHPDPNVERYERAVFAHPDVTSRQGPRVLFAITYGYEPPRHLDMTPMCRNHMCMNILHYRLTPHGISSMDTKLQQGIDPATFKCETVQAA